MRRAVLLPLICAVALFVTACRVDVGVEVSVVEDGSGTVVVTVQLDPDAARRLGGAGGLRVEDLRVAGWSIDEPAVADDGSVTVVGRRGFSGPDQLSTVLAEVGGPDGVFSDVRLEVDDGFGRTEYEFSTTVNLTGSPEQFSDPALAEALDGMPLARSPEELAAAGADDPAAATLELSVALPGGDPSTSGEVEQDRASWTFPITGGEPTNEQVHATSVASRGRTGVLVGIAVLALVAAAVAGTVGILRRRS